MPPRILLGLALASAATAAAQQGTPPKPVEGRPASTHGLDCVAPDEVTADETPPDVYTGVRNCIARGDYDRAAALFAMAGAFGAFDRQRVADVSARDAPQVLAYLLSGSLTAEQKKGLGDAVTRLDTDAASRQPVCAAATKVGSPAYVPSYMIRHGLNAIDKSAAAADPYVPGFDATATWARVRTVYLGCPT